MRGVESGLALALTLESAAVIEEILAREDMHLDRCNAFASDALCGFSLCDSCGCMTDKLSRAQDFIALHLALTGERK